MKNGKNIELLKIEIEKLKFLEGLFRTIFLGFVADISGTVAILLNIKKYNPTIATSLIVLGVFSAFGLAYILLVIVAEMKKIKKKLDKEET